MLDKIITRAKEERETLLHEVATLGYTIGILKEERAALLLGNGLDGDSQEVMRINERLNNARRVLAARNRRRECLDFLLTYVETYMETGVE